MADRTQSIAPIVDPDQFSYKGLTKLEWMTGMILQGMASRTSLDNLSVTRAVDVAYLALDHITNYEGGQ